MKYLIRYFFREDILMVNSRCKDRMNTEPENLKGGMGDIFVLLSLINPLSDHGSLQCFV